MKRHLRGFRLLKLALLGSAGLLASAFPATADPAQDTTVAQNQAPAAEAAPEVAPAGIEEVVVTATRREEDLQKVPVAVTAITAKTLEDKHVTTVEDLAVATPSLVATSAFSSTQVNFTLRGRAPDNNTFGNSQTVAVYLDDVPEVSASLAQFYDLESVQVLRGPQGTLFGRATNGGAILFTPTRPGDTMEGYITGQLGNYADKEIQGGITVPVTDGLSVRVAGDLVHRDGYTKVLNENDFDLDNKNSAAFRIGVLFTPIENVENYLVYDFTDINQHSGSFHLLAARSGMTASNFINPSNATFQNFLASNPDLAAIPGVSGGLQSYLNTIASIGPRAVYYNVPVDQLPFKSRTNLLANTTTVHLGDVTFKNIFGYQTERRAAGYEADGTPFPILDGETVDVLPANQILNHHQLSDEIQFLGAAFDGRFEWLVGAFYSDLHDDDPGNTYMGWALGLLGAPVTYAPTRFDKSSKAIFTQESFHITPELTASLGYRYTEDRSRAQQYAISQPLSSRGVPDAPPVCPGTAIPANFSSPQCLGILNSLRSSGSNWSADISYQITEDVFGYASFKTGYQPGGVNTTSTISFLKQFSPETVKQYEVGLKTTVNIGQVATRLNLAAYTQQISNGQVAFIVTDPVTNRIEGVTLNAKSARVRGLEAEGDFIFNDYIRLNAFANVTDASYESFDLPNIVVDASSSDGIRIASYTDVSGNPFPNVPKFQAGWTLNLKAPVPDNIGDIEGALTYYHQNSFVFSNDFANESEGFASGYGLWNINIDWNKPLGNPFDLSFFVANLADKVYDRGGISVERQLGITEVFYGEPRTFGFRLKYSFGGAQ